MPVSALGPAPCAGAASRSSGRRSRRAKFALIFRRFGERTLPMDSLGGGPGVLAEVLAASPESGAVFSIRIWAPDDEGKDDSDEGTVRMRDISAVFTFLRRCCEDDKDRTRWNGLVCSIRDALRTTIRREMVDICSTGLREECDRLKLDRDWTSGSDEELLAAADCVVCTCADIDGRALADLSRC